MMKLASIFIVDVRAENKRNLERIVIPIKLINDAVLLIARKQIKA
jgi:hypothetical protein